MPLSLGRRAVLQSAAGSLAGGTASAFTPRASVEWTATVADGAQVRVVGDAAFVAGRDLLVVDAAAGTERWRVEGDDWVRPEAVGGDAVFVERDGDLRAHAAATGRHRWTLEDARAATYRDGVVVGVTRSGRAVAVDAADGRERWTADLDLTPLGSHAVDADRVYVGDRGRFHALDAATGEVHWTLDVDGDSFVRHALAGFEPERTSSAVVAGVVPVWDTDGVLLGVDADGTERWRIERVPETNTPPVTRHSDALVVAGDGRLSSYDAATGVERWRVETGGGGWPRSVGDAVYVSDGDAVHAVAPATGAVRWRARLDSERPVHLGEVADGTVAVSSWDGWVGALDAADGALRWRYDHGGEPAWLPEVADGRVYLGTRDGRAFALSPPDTPASPLHRLPAPAVAGGLAVAGALAAAGYRRLRT